MGSKGRISNVINVLALLCTTSVASASPWGRADSYTFDEGMSVDAGTATPAPTTQKQSKKKRSGKLPRAVKTTPDTKASPDAPRMTLPAQEKDK
jgi:hypothetical protein